MLVLCGIKVYGDKIDHTEYIEEKLYNQQQSIDEELDLILD